MYLLLRLQLVAKDAYGWVPLGSFDTDASCSNAAKYLREVKATSVKHFFRIPTTVAKKADIFVRSGKVSEGDWRKQNSEDRQMIDINLIH
jgi:hypothetical protein